MKANKSFVRLKLTAENTQDLSLLDQIIARLQEGKALSEYVVDGAEQTGEKKSEKGKK